MENLTELGENYLEQLSKEKCSELLPMHLYIMILTITGAFGNAMVCIFYNRKETATPTTRLIIALAIIDMVVCILMPKNFVFLCLSYKSYPAVVCKLNIFTNHATSISSAFVLVAIAVFRFRAVCKPLATQFTLGHANYSVLVSCVLGIVLSAPILFTVDKVPVAIRVNTNRTLKGHDCRTSTEKTVQLLDFSVGIVYFSLFFVATIMFIVLYTLIGKGIFKYYHKKRAIMAKVRNKSKAVNSNESPNILEEISDVTRMDSNSLSSNNWNMYCNGMAASSAGIPNRPKIADGCYNCNRAETTCDTDTANKSTTTFQNQLSQKSFCNTDEETRTDFVGNASDTESNTSAHAKCHTISKTDMADVICRQVFMFLCITVIFILSSYHI